jgi:diguanylate cyclase (GGDEF)-like protein/PAS domain S-box-containing protein
VTETPCRPPVETESESRYRLLADNVTDVIWTTDMDLRVTYVSPSVTRLRGYAVQEVLGQSVHEALTPDSAAVGLAALEEELARENGRNPEPFWSRRLELEMTCKDGSTVWTESTVSFLRDESGLPVGILGVSRDITERRRQEDRIRLLQTALESAANAVAITDRQGVIEWVNGAFTRLTGYSFEEAVGQTPRLLKSGSQSQAFYREMWGTIKGGEAWRGEMLNRRKDGSLYAEEQTITPVTDGQGRITHFVAIKLDISDRRQQEERVLHLAMHDALTDLPNRRALQKTLDHARAAARRGKPGACLFLDLDYFKRVNDTAGHDAGDEFLRGVARVLRGTVRPTDFLARLGGDEFAVVLEDTPPDMARTVAERVRRSVGAYRPEIGGRPFDTSVSIGVTTIDGEQEPTALLRLADAALYAAKHHGRNRVVVHETGVDGPPRRGSDSPPTRRS